MSFEKLPKFTFWRAVLLVILAAGFYSTLLRFTKGLGAATHLSDRFPWGLWIGFDVICGVGLAAGGFTLAATVYVFHLRRFHPILRPSILTAFLGYALVAVALLFDLGKPYNIWHPLVMWNPHSVMFEVAWCVMLYLTVLALEFSPAVFERFGMQKPLKLLKAITIPLVIVGVLLSTLHQSSLGSLFLIVPSKLHPYWYSPLLPLFFFISAVATGMAIVIFESNLSARAFGREIEMPLLASLGKAMAGVLIVYGILRLQDLWRRGALVHLREPSTETVLFALGNCAGTPDSLVSVAPPPGARGPGGALCGRRTGDHRFSAQSPERFDYRSRVLRPRALLSEMDGGGRDALHGGHHVSLLRPGGALSQCV